MKNAFLDDKSGALLTTESTWQGKRSDVHRGVCGRKVWSKFHQGAPFIYRTSDIYDFYDWAFYSLNFMSFLVLNHFIILFLNCIFLGSWP